MRIGKIKDVRWKKIFLNLSLIGIGIFIGYYIATYKINQQLIGIGLKPVKMVMNLPFDVNIIIP